jgi:hypothetical protein
MKKTLLVIIIFLAFAAVMALSFSLFFVPKKEIKLRYNDCILLQNPQTMAVDCFGCANKICKDAPGDWIVYKKPDIGIPYACFKNAQGCQLAQ